ncbi:MAG TPA: hypothetical protein VLH83_06665 [Chthoniobacterales bacterium]|nr:hypothetical protein [Chthoniobacterales bacterium]
MQVADHADRDALDGERLAREVEMMTEAGLIESSGTVYGLETFAVIKRVTEAGQSFLRAFKDHPPSAQIAAA